MQLSARANINVGMIRFQSCDSPVLTLCYHALRQCLLLCGAAHLLSNSLVAEELVEGDVLMSMLSLMKSDQQVALCHIYSLAQMLFALERI